jgi:hypothetical protein
MVRDRLLWYLSLEVTSLSYVFETLKFIEEYVEISFLIYRKHIVPTLQRQIY